MILFLEIWNPIKDKISLMFSGDNKKSLGYSKMKDIYYSKNKMWFLKIVSNHNYSNCNLYYSDIINYYIPC